jgi:hypothetical protein
MGRPIKKKFFAGGAVTAVTAGERVNTVTVLTSGTNYSGSTTVTFSQPDLPGGSVATGHVSVAGGTIASLTVDSGGSGYTQDPGIALGSIGTGTGATFSVSLAGVSNTGKITCSAYLPAHSTAAQTSSILDQESSHRYQVQNADGTGICRLAASGSLTAGQMSITATDSSGGTYYVTKLTARKALLTPINGTQFAAGSYAKWILSNAGSAVANSIVTIAVG